MRRSGRLLWLGGWLGLACAGGGPGQEPHARPPAPAASAPAPPAAPTASSGASALCDHLSRELDCPCTAVAVGEPVEVDGFSVKALKAKTWTGKSTLPDIPNLDERNEMSRTENHALAIDLQLTNAMPVRAGVEFVIYLQDGAGESRFTMPYNSGLYAKSKKNLSHLREVGELAPNAKVKAGLVYAVPRAAVRHSLLVLRKNVEKPDPADPRGRLKVFATELAVLDLGPPT